MKLIPIAQIVREVTGDGEREMHFYQGTMGNRTAAASAPAPASTLSSLSSTALEKSFETELERMIREEFEGQ